MSEPLFPRPVAHRGLHDRARGIIENSASAFAAAIEGGFAIECDLQLSNDGVPMVFHDDTLERLTGESGRVSEHTAAELGAMTLLGSEAGDRPQTFDAFLAQVDGRALLQVELKHQRDGESTRDLAKAAATSLSRYAGPVTVESFDPQLITLVREFGFSGPRGIITYDYEGEDYPPGITDDERYILKHLLHWQQTRFDFISCDHTALTLPAITFWRTLGKPVTAWTIRSKIAAETARLHADQIVFEGFIPDSAS